MGTDNTVSAYADFEEETAVTEVHSHEEHWSLSFKGSGWSLPKSYGYEPKVGDLVRLRLVQGSKVAACYINGQKIFDKTPEELDAEHKAMVAQMDADKLAAYEKEKPDLDRRFAALPELFQIRIQKFRDNNPSFRWNYESYEMFCCEEALKIAQALGAQDRHPLEPVDLLETRFKAFQDLDFAEQKKLTGFSDGHSGNTFGIAVHLAYLYLKTPENVPKMHGALAPLVGSQAYGDVPPEEAGG